MRAPSSLALLCSFVAIVVVACSSASDSTPSAPPECAAYFDALVSFGDKCGHPVSSPARIAERKANVLTRCQNELAAPGASKTAAAAFRTCADRLNAATSCADVADCELPPGDLDGGAACLDDFQCRSGRCKVAPGAKCGTCAERAAIGEPCDYGQHACVDGATCTSTDGSIDLKCFAVKIAKEGERCHEASILFRCADGLHCPELGTPEPTATAVTCAPVAQSGERCAKQGDCVMGLACVCAGEPSWNCVVRKCGPGVPEGGACVFNAFIKNEDCAVGLACDPSGKCARPGFAASGQPCDLFFTFCDVGFCGSLPAKGASRGVCVDPVADGRPCLEPNAGTWDAENCGELSACIGGTCHGLDATQCK